MKKIFLDTNFVIDYLIREEYKPEAIEFLSQGVSRGFRFFISFLTVANLAYIIRKLPVSQREEYIKSICSLFEVVPNNVIQIRQAIEIGAKDFEDAIQYATALEAGCECIITRNGKDFNFSKLPVCSAGEYVFD